MEGQSTHSAPTSQPHVTFCYRGRQLYCGGEIPRTPLETHCHELNLTVCGLKHQKQIIP